MWVLGLGGSNHDFGAAIAHDGVLTVAIEDERIQRVRHGLRDWHGHPARDAANYCLATVGRSIADMDGVFCCDDLERPSGWIDWSKVSFVNHHMCHAAASYFTSPATRSTLLVIDGHGSPVCETSAGSWEVETMSVGWAEGSTLDLEPLQTGLQKMTSSSWQYVTQNSIGWFYEIVTSALGFGEWGQGKTMGLAGYGTASYVDSLRGFIEICADGRFQFDPYGGLWDWLGGTLSSAANPMQVRADIAYAVQDIAADAIVAAAKEAYRRAPSSTLSFGGGCALNTLANSRILAETPFEELFIFPAAGDNGLAVGAALYGMHAKLGVPRREPPTDWRARAAYLGRDLRSPGIAEALAGAPVFATEPDDLVGEVAAALAGGEIVAVCRGASEIGPRALGHRSLLALPGPAQMRDHVNLNVKHRESFRPLAPVVPIEHVATYFTGVSESPHMLLVATVRPDHRASLAAVTHIDGTARVQTVRAEDEPFLHALLNRVGALTGTPVLLNTSLNARDQPIVETPADALALFVSQPIDLLVLGDHVVRKYTPWAISNAVAAPVARRRGGG